MKETDDTRHRSKVARSYVAIPFLGPGDEVVTILFADTHEENFFSDDDRLRKLKAMCDSFCRLFDYLQDEPFAKLRNFPLLSGEPSEAKPTVYGRLQEGIDWLDPPRFKNITSFNYEASSAA